MGAVGTNGISRGWLPGEARPKDDGDGAERQRTHLERPVTDDLSLEQWLVTEAIRRALGPDCPGRPVAPRHGDSPDWDAVAALALEQSVAALAAAKLGSLGLATPGRILIALRRAAALDAASSTVGLVLTFQRVIGALDSVGLRPVVLKGAMLAYTAYRQPSQRTLGDVDLLLPKHELDRAHLALVRHGFVNDDAVAAADPKVNHHLQPYYSKGTGVAVELHHQLLSEPHPYALDVAGFRARAEVKPVAGIDVLIPSPADALHHVCIHLAYPHRYEKAPLRSLVDVLAITTSRQSEIDWDLFLTTVRSARTAGAVYWPLRLSQAWLGAPIPEFVMSRLAPPAPVRRLLEAFVEPGFILNGRAARGGSDIVLCSFLRDVSLCTGCSPSVQVEAVWRGLFPPPDGVGHLPASVTGQPWRYAAYLANPRRLSRGMLAFGRLMVRAAWPPRERRSARVDTTGSDRRAETPPDVATP